MNTNTTTPETLTENLEISGSVPVQSPSPSPSPSPIPSAADVTAAILAMDKKSLLAMIAEAEKREAAKAQADAAELTEYVSDVLLELNDVLANSPRLIEANVGHLALELVPAKAHVDHDNPAIPAHYRVVRVQGRQQPARQPRQYATRTGADNGAASGTQAVNLGMSVPRIVDGIEYRSYREAWDSLGLNWNGRNRSFNARIELIKLGYTVSGPTR